MVYLPAVTSRLGFLYRQIDSHVQNNSGAIIMMADSPSTSSTAGKPKIKQSRKGLRGIKKRKDDKKKQAEFLTFAF